MNILPFRVASVGLINTDHQLIIAIRQTETGWIVGCIPPSPSAMFFFANLLYACALTGSLALGSVQNILKAQGSFALPKVNGSETVHLSSLTSDEFTVLQHPRFPSHQVRVKKSHFCDPTVKSVHFTAFMERLRLNFRD